MELTHPITNYNQIEKMSQFLREQSERNYLLFVMGINLGFRVSDYTQQKVGFYREACQNGVIELKPEKQSNKKKKERALAEGKDTSHIKPPKRVYVAIPQELNTTIMNYIDGRDDEEFMFPSRKGGTPITRQQIYKIITDAANYAGIQESIGCHGMRKTFGYWHFKKNRNIRLLMLIFGHSDEAVTLRYIGVTNEDIKESMVSMNLGL